MSTVLAVFVDGLKPDSLAHMPFLDSVSFRRRIRTDLGYSITCHASMYTGVYPEKHKMWFLWQYNPQRSPFRWIPDARIASLLDNLGTRYLAARMARLFVSNSSYAGLSVMKKSALRNWRYFDTTEKKLWIENGYIEGYPTIFDIISSRQIMAQYVGVGTIKQAGGALSHIRNYSVGQKVPRFIYLFIGEVDHVSHMFGQQSPQAKQVLREVDQEVCRIYEQVRARTRADPLLVCWSDHGHMMAPQQYDIYEGAAKVGLPLDRYVHIIDTNYARFWFRNDRERRDIEDLLKHMPAGRILSDEDLRKYHTVMPDRRYGDLIFYLDAPYMFKRTVWGYGRHIRSIHGYLPDYPDKDGVFVSNIPIAKQSKLELVDVAPSILALLDCGGEGDYDGSPVW